MSFFTIIVARPAGSTLFPYTTLFRSGRGVPGPFFWAGRAFMDEYSPIFRTRMKEDHAQFAGSIPAAYDRYLGPRSEEHTSELQSRLHLVCRLLLEKKNKEPHCADQLQ